MLSRAFLEAVPESLIPLLLLLLLLVLLPPSSCRRYNMFSKPLNPLMSSKEGGQGQADVNLDDATMAESRCVVFMLVERPGWAGI